MDENLAHAQKPLKSDRCRAPVNITAHVKRSDQACSYPKPASLAITAAQAVSTCTSTACHG